MSTVALHAEVRPSANLQVDPKEEFRAIDGYVREYFKQWVQVAQLCLRVKSASLWRYGGFHSWDDWIESFEGKSARTIRYYTGTFSDLEPDFSPDEMAAMKPETAKVMRKLSPSVRRDPKVREASTRKRRDFVQVVQQEHPGQLIEDESVWGFTLSETERSIVEEEFEHWRAEDPKMSDSEILVALCIAANEVRRGEGADASHSKA